MVQELWSDTFHLKLTARILVQQREVITRPKTSFRKMTLPSVAVFSAMCLSCMLLRKFHQKTTKVISETLAMRVDSTEVIILNPFVTYIGVSCAESYVPVKSKLKHPPGHTQGI